jgi:hypothetical protein
MSTKKNDATVNRRDFLKKGAVAGAGAGALAGLGIPEAEAQGNAQRRWDMTADFVTIGAGVSGLAGAVSALDHKASVIMLEENFDIGGHGMVSGGNVHLGRREQPAAEAWSKGFGGPGLPGLGAA